MKEQRAIIIIYYLMVVHSITLHVGVRYVPIALHPTMHTDRRYKRYTAIRIPASLFVKNSNSCAHSSVMIIGLKIPLLHLSKKPLLVLVRNAGTVPVR